MKKLRIIFIFFILPLVTLSARGSHDRDREYFQELETTCESLFPELEAGNMAPDKGKMLLAELRNRFSRPFTDSDGILESLIDQVAESRLSTEQAMYEFSLLKEGELMTYRQEQKAGDALADPPGSSSQGGKSAGAAQSNQPMDSTSEQSSDKGNKRKDGG